MYGSDNLSALDEADGEDRITVYYLQSMDVAAGHTLTLDGQAGTDTYTIYTTGSRATASGIRDYVINLLDTGAPADGVDEAAIYGIDNTDPAFNGYLPGTATIAPNDDVFLLRASTCIPAAGGYNCTGANEIADAPAFVAVLHGPVGTYADLIQSNEPTTAVQRINYDTALNGRLSVFGLGGNDHFYVDDTTATITLDGGAGFDTFQIGQIFGTKRDEASGRRPAAGPIPEPDRHHPRLAEPRHPRPAGGHRRHRQRLVHRLRQPGRVAARRRRRLRPVRRPRLRPRADL